MVVYVDERFDTDSVGSWPGWTKNYDFSEIRIEDGIGIISYPVNEQGGWRKVRLNAPAPRVGGEAIRMRLRWKDNPVPDPNVLTQQAPGVWLMLRDANDGTWAALYIGLTIDTGSGSGPYTALYSLHTLVNGSPQNLNLKQYSEDNWLNIYAELEGDEPQIRFKLWMDNETEPEIWDREEPADPENGTVTASGFGVGVASDELTSVNPVLFDYIAVTDLASKGIILPSTNNSGLWLRSPNPRRSPEETHRINLQRDIVRAIKRR